MSNAGGFVCTTDTIIYVGRFTEDSIRRLTSLSNNFTAVDGISGAYVKYLQTSLSLTCPLIRIEDVSEELKRNRDKSLS